MSTLRAFVRSVAPLLSVPLIGWASAARVSATIGVGCSGAPDASDCLRFPEVRLLSDASTGSALVVLALFATIGFGAHFCRGNPQRLAVLFGPQIRLTLLVLAGLVLVQGAILTYSVFIVSVVVFHLIHIYALAFLAFGTIAACGAMLWSLGTMDLRPGNSVLAVPVSRSNQSRLWNLIENLAAAADAPVPDHLLMGLNPSFYAASGKTRFTGTKQSISGETLHLSAPALHVLSEKELTAIIVHELAHFRAADTLYTRRFLPIYRGLEGALQGLTAGWSLWNLARLPTVSVLRFAYEQFSLAARSISREREFAADRLASEVAGPLSVVSALVKLGILSPTWPQMEELAFSLLNQGREASNIAETFEEHATHLFTETAPDLLLDRVLALHQPHPIDTHPTLGARAAALGVPLVDAAVLIRRDGVPASSLIDGLADIETMMTKHLNRIMTERVRPAAA